MLSEQKLIIGFINKGCSWELARVKALQAKKDLPFSSRPIEEIVEEYMLK